MLNGKNCSNSQKYDKFPTLTKCFTPWIKFTEYITRNYPNEARREIIKINEIKNFIVKIIPFSDAHFLYEKISLDLILRFFKDSLFDKSVVNEIVFSIIFTNLENLNDLEHLYSLVNGLDKNIVNEVVKNYPTFGLLNDPYGFPNLTIGEICLPSCENILINIESNAESTEEAYIVENEYDSAEWFWNNFSPSSAQTTKLYKHASHDFAILSAIYNILSSKHSNEDIQESLCDLLGYELFDSICELLTKRSNILTQLLELASRRNIFLRYEDQLNILDTKYQNITLSTEAKNLALRKAEKNNKRIYEKFKKNLSHLNWNALDQFFIEINILESDNIKHSHLESRAARSQNENTEEYPYVFNNQKRKCSANKIDGVEFILPTETKVILTALTEEVIIPCEDYVNYISWPLLKISELDGLSKQVFKELDAFNTIQSLVFEKALESSENLLICAPTGSGKTNTALLTILRELKLNYKNDKLNKDNIKIVYVAPLKALASEITYKFQKSLRCLGIIVRELTGDMQLTKQEISVTNIIVTTPEKWDILTRKANTDSIFTLTIKLLIIDEIHLLQDDRGSVIEAIVARTLRFVEAQQANIRIIGLSATLPNYIDVASFLRVNPYTGLFYFDGSYRPVPLEQALIGVFPSPSKFETQRRVDETCFEKVICFAKERHQVIIFVHSRDSTRKTGHRLKEFIENNNYSSYFQSDQINQHVYQKRVSHEGNKVLGELLPYSIGTHHAGMLKQDRTLVEELFSKGQIRVLVSTSTLAWGVNLPAHAVIIKGTSFYDSSIGTFKNMGILDVQQMFGRAGRPQFDETGVGVLITEHSLLRYYTSLLLHTNPIESQLLKELTDVLNAEISLGTVETIDDGIKWFSYTYIYIRMRKNPLVYGIDNKELNKDTALVGRRTYLITECAKLLDKSKMVRYNPKSGFISPTTLGRIASNYYIKQKSIDIFNQSLRETMSDMDILLLISLASEFESIKAREEESGELKELGEKCRYHCESEEITQNKKVIILLMSYISNQYVNSPSLLSDMMYISQNINRIIRALFEICLYYGWPMVSYKLLTFIKAFECKMWPGDHPFLQFQDSLKLNPQIFRKLSSSFSIERLRDMTSQEIGDLLHHVSAGHVIKDISMSFPTIEVLSNVQPLTRSVLQITLTFIPTFKWNPTIMSIGSDVWLYWIEDPDSHYMYHHSSIRISLQNFKSNQPIQDSFTIPIFEPLPSQYIVRVMSEKFVGAESECFINVDSLVLPQLHSPFTDLLKLQPLPVDALKCPDFQKIFNFSFFNPIQTQLFHTMYHKDVNVLLGAPTGSGKTVVAEIGMLRIFKKSSRSKIIYIAPIKALVKERVNDWKNKFKSLNKKVIELTGDVTPDTKSIYSSDVIVTTPEKWDGISRAWRRRSYVCNIALVILDEVHLLGADRGHILEAIVARIKIISNWTNKPIRIVALSTAVANSLDLAKWLDIPHEGLFNFRPSVRPVPIVAHISGFPLKAYAPRMESMNKAVYQSIRSYSDEKPVIVFASSRRQTRRTAQALSTFSSSNEKQDKWCKLTSSELFDLNVVISDENVKYFLSFGIGIHNAGLKERDRTTIEQLFLNCKIQILIATSTLAWGVNFPAHLVIIKGTEFYDAQIHGYKDFPVSDLLQMMGRAGRCQFDDSGVAVILVLESKKNFYKKFLYEPFPVESCFLSALPDHINAEIVAGTITCPEDVLDYLALTFCMIRIKDNPSFYGFSKKSENTNINSFLIPIIQDALDQLISSNCIYINDETNELVPTKMGEIASDYYLSNETISFLYNKLVPNTSLAQLLSILSHVKEFKKVPVRHNEDKHNMELSKQLPLKVESDALFNDPNIKVFLLLQAHILRHELPIVDYLTDTLSVIDQSLRILGAMKDICIYKNCLSLTIECVLLNQALIQAAWPNNSSLHFLPYINEDICAYFSDPNNNCFRKNISSLPELLKLSNTQYETLERDMKKYLRDKEVQIFMNFIHNLPFIEISWSICTEDGQTFDGNNVIQNNLIDGEPSIDNSNTLKLPANVNLTLSLTIKSQYNRKSTIVSPYMHKNVEETWIVLLGDKTNDNLIAHKNIPAIKFIFKTSLFVGQLPKLDSNKSSHHPLTLYILNNVLIGMDQQYQIPIEII